MDSGRMADFSWIIVQIRATGASGKPFVASTGRRVWSASGGKDRRSSETNLFVTFVMAPYLSKLSSPKSRLAFKNLLALPSKGKKHANIDVYPVFLNVATYCNDNSSSAARI